jgi:nicotinamidase-related amidase
MTKPPPTLIELAGFKPEPARLSNAVLLVIDAQREYVDGRLPLAGIDESLAVGAALLARARAASAPVVHVLHRGAGALFNPQADGFQPAAPMTPLAGEAIVEKTLANAFAATNLAEVLERTGRRQLIVIGYMTHNCVSATVRAARDHGYAATVVAPATGTRDLPDGRGGTLPAAAVQAACLAGLSDATATIVWNAAEIAD